MKVLQKIETHILPSARIEAYGTPSASIAILSEDEIETNVATMGPENHQTLYLADSMSKSITAVAIAKLVDKGLLKFDSNIADFMKIESYIHHPESAGLCKHITVEMLLTHMSGLVGNPACNDPSCVFPKGQCLHLSAFPGSKWHYSGDAFAVLQPVMENVCEKPFAQLMDDLVAGPLCLTRTFWGDQPPPNQTNYAMPHVNGAQIALDPTLRRYQLASKGMWTTPSDLMKVVLAVQRSLKVTDSFLTLQSAEYMLQIETPPHNSKGLPDFDALGWYKTKTVFAHRGAWSQGGYHSYMFGFYGPDVGSLQTASCAVMTNSIEGIRAIQALVNAIMYMKCWPRQIIMPSNLGIDSSVPCHAPAGVVINPQWQEWIGDWAIGSRRGWSIVKVAGRPMFKFREMHAVSLRPAAMPRLKFEDSRCEIALTSPELPGIALRLTWLDDERVVELLYMSMLLLRRDVPQATLSAGA